MLYQYQRSIYSVVRRLWVLLVVFSPGQLQISNSNFSPIRRWFCKPALETAYRFLDTEQLSFINKTIGHLVSVIKLDEFLCCAAWVVVSNRNRRYYLCCLVVFLVLRTVVNIMPPKLCEFCELCEFVSFASFVRVGIFARGAASLHTLIGWLAASCSGQPLLATFSAQQVVA